MIETMMKTTETRWNKEETKNACQNPFQQLTPLTQQPLFSPNGANRSMKMLTRSERRKTEIENRYYQLHLSYKKLHVFL